MKIRLHHIEMCVKDPVPVITLLCGQFGLDLSGYRETEACLQFVLQLKKTTFLITSRKGTFLHSQNNNGEDILSKFGTENDTEKCSQEREDYWTHFCCDKDEGNSHIDSVFNVAMEVPDLEKSLKVVENSGANIIKKPQRLPLPQSNDWIDFAIVKSICGNVIHTLIQKSKSYGEWFLPGFHRIRRKEEEEIWNLKMSHFDHVTLACRVGETEEVILWYEKVFGMKRFITNRQETEEEGLVIEDDVGMRLKVIEFWKCAEAGIASQNGNEKDEGKEWEPLKIVIAESLPYTRNTQIESFISEHNGPGIQHVGLHTETMTETVRELTKRGVKFRHPPPTYYTEIGQLKVIEASGENVESLRNLGILLDDEADVFDELDEEEPKEKYLMQVFTHPIFKEDTFFLEVIQRKGARGFGVGNVTALARSVNAYQKMLQQEKENSDDKL